MTNHLNPPDNVQGWLVSFGKLAQSCAASREWTRLAEDLTMLGIPQPGEVDSDSGEDADLAWVEANREDYASLVGALIPRAALKPLAAVFARDVKTSRVCSRPEYATFLRDWLRSL